MLLSIITVNLNNKAGLQKTIESVLNQQAACFEYIIIDGGSTDGSKEVIENAQHQFSYWVSEKDEGIYHAMNKGIKLAKGDFILLLNSGDCLYHANSISILSQHLNHSGDIYYTDVMLNTHPPRLKRYPEKLTVDFFLSTSLCHQTTVISKKIFQQLGLYDCRYNLIADWLLLLRSFQQNKSFTYIPDIILAYFDPGGISNNFELNQKQRAIALKDNLPHLMGQWHAKQRQLRWQYRFNKIKTLLNIN